MGFGLDCIDRIYAALPVNDHGHGDVGRHLGDRYART